jgi:hypothetical protein
MANTTATDTTRAPRENQILAEPATTQRCAEDYAAAADVRTAMGKQARAGGK